jgi:hypothetical protein
MRLKTILTLLLSLSLYFSTKSQETRFKFIGLEGGYNFISCYPSDLSNFRGEMAAFYSTDVKINIRGLCDKKHMGAKFEVRTMKNKFGLSGGLRFTHYVSSIGRDYYYDTPTDFFYYRFRDEETFSEYVKIKSFTQKSSYLSIPVELRYFPFMQKNFRIYFKSGAEVGFLMDYKNSVDFYNDEMDLYETEVSEDFADPSTVFTTLYFSAGIQIGRDTRPGLNLEVCLPYMFLSGEVSGLITPEFGGGLHLSFHYPLIAKNHE